MSLSIKPFIITTTSSPSYSFRILSFITTVPPYRRLVLFSVLVCLVSISILSTTSKQNNFVVNAQSSSCSVVDPYSNECLSVDNVVSSCDVATAISKCGCSTCALPGCVCVTKKCGAQGKLIPSSGTCECEKGWTTEYSEFPCASRIGVSTDLITSSTKPALINSLTHQIPTKYSDVIQWIPPIALTLLALIIAHFMVFRA